MTSRFLKIFTIAAGLTWLAQWFYNHFELFVIPTPIIVWGGVAIFIAMLSGCVGSRQFLHYVGEKGVASFILDGDNSTVFKDIFIFYKAEFLERSYKDNLESASFLYHAIDEEKCYFVWQNAAFEKKFAIFGINTHQDYPSPPQIKYLFGCAAEKAWTHHLTRTVGTFIKADRSIFFPLALEQGWVSFEGDNLRYQIKGIGGGFKFAEIVQIGRSHQDLIIKLFFVESSKEEILHIPLIGFPNNRFFFSILELYTGLKVPTKRPVPNKKLQHFVPPPHMADREIFYDRMDIALSYSKRSSTNLLIVVIELNNLVFINHSYGRDVGTNTLNIIGDRLEAAFDHNEHGVARMEGTEFAAIQPDFSSHENIEIFLATIQQKLSQPITVKNKVIEPEIYVGHGIFPKDGKKVDSLLKIARTRMYSKKYSALFNLQRHSYKP
ncbi:MAG: GGDEF domain-containing protein [Magnetococcales bacterium]|nr:GGDEF domain-containing protein [Magnetococcales bacterium]